MGVDSTMTISEISPLGEMQESDVLAMVQDVKAYMRDTTELDAVREIKRLKKTIEDKRKTERESIKGQLEDLQRQLSLISANSERGIADWRTPSQHAAEMERLNTEKFALAKANDELQRALERLEQSKREEEERIEAIEAENPAEEGDADMNAISLKIMRQIGFQPLYKRERLTMLSNAPTFDEITVRSRARDAATIVDVGEEWVKEQDITAIALADQLWKHAS